MGNDKPKGIDAIHLAAAAALMGCGIFAAQWIIRHPDDVRRFYMGVYRATFHAAHAAADRSRFVADRAATGYNRMRSSDA